MLENIKTWLLKKMYPKMVILIFEETEMIPSQVIGDARVIDITEHRDENIENDIMNNVTDLLNRKDK